MNKDNNIIYNKFVKKYRNIEFCIDYNEITYTIFKGVYIIKGNYQIMKY